MSFCMPHRLCITRTELCINFRLIYFYLTYSRSTNLLKTAIIIFHFNLSCNLSTQIPTLVISTSKLGDGQKIEPTAPLKIYHKSISFQLGHCVYLAYHLSCLSHRKTCWTILVHLLCLGICALGTSTSLVTLLSLV